MSTWTVFSNHGHVLLFLARFPEARLRDVAEKVGITERAVQKIVKDLQDSKVISVHKHGRRNRYRVNTRQPLRHELEAHRTIGSLIKLVQKKSKRHTRPDDSPMPGAATEAADPGISEAIKTGIRTGGPENLPVSDPGTDIKTTGSGYEPDREQVPLSAYEQYDKATAEKPGAQTEAVPETPLPAAAEPKAKAVDKPTARKKSQPKPKDKPGNDNQGSLF